VKGASRLDAIVAAFIGLVALAVSGYTAYIQKQQVRAQVWPYLETSSDNMPLRLIVTNRGVGPAIVKDVAVTVDGQPVTNWKDLLDRIAKQHNHFYSTIHRRVVSAGERVDVLQPHDDKGKDVFASDPKGSFGDLLNQALPRIDMRICYCSTLEDCWTVDDAGTRATRVCPAPSATSFRE
jgi:hypothetical protein